MLVTKLARVYAKALHNLALERKGETLHTHEAERKARKPTYGT